MAGLVRRFVLSAVVALAVMGCGSSASTAPRSDQVAPSNVDVAAPDMVAVKQAGKVEDCPAAQTAGGGLPKVTVRCLGGGRTVDLSTLKGPLVINVFQAACVECIKEEPALAAFYRAHGAQYPVIGIDALDMYPGVALKDAVKRGVTYPLLADPGGDALDGPLAITAYPTFFFLHADGHITKTLGGKTSEAEILTMVTDQFNGTTATGGNSSDTVIITALSGIVVLGGGVAYALRRRRASNRRDVVA